MIEIPHVEDNDLLARRDEINQIDIAPLIGTKVEHMKIQMFLQLRPLASINSQELGLV